MVNEEKVRTMTRLATVMNRDGVEIAQDSGYFKSDYIRSHTIYVVWSYTLGYLLILGMIALYYMNYLTSGVGIVDYWGLVSAIVAVYALILVGCIFFSVLIFSKRYRRLQEVSKVYVDLLDEMDTYYKKSKEGGNL